MRGFPTIKIFGANKNKAEDYNGDRSANGLTNAVISAIRSKVQASLGTRGSDSSGSDDVIDSSSLLWHKNTVCFYRVPILST